MIYDKLQKKFFHHLIFRAAPPTPFKSGSSDTFVDLIPTKSTARVSQQYIDLITKTADRNGRSAANTRTEQQQLVGSTAALDATNQQLTTRPATYSALEATTTPYATMATTIADQVSSVTISRVISTSTALPGSDIGKEEEPSTEVTTEFTSAAPVNREYKAHSINSKKNYLFICVTFQ